MLVLKIALWYERNSHTVSCLLTFVHCMKCPRVSSLFKPSVLNATLHQYLATLGPNNLENIVIDKLKNKVLQVDNPIKSTDSLKCKALEQYQTSRILSAKERKKRGLHLLHLQSFSYVLSFDETVLYSNFL